MISIPSVAKTERSDDMRNRFTQTVVFILYLALVGYLCFGNGPDGVELPKALFGIPFDKCVHFCMFLPFPVLGTFAFRGRNFYRTLVLFFVLALIVSFSMEMLQTPLTDGRRVTDPWDLIANFAGITLGVLVMIGVGLCRKFR